MSCVKVLVVSYRTGVQKNVAIGWNAEASSHLAFPLSPCDRAAVRQRGTNRICTSMVRWTERTRKCQRESGGWTRPGRWVLILIRGAIWSHLKAFQSTSSEDVSDHIKETSARGLILHGNCFIDVPESDQFLFCQNYDFCFFLLQLFTSMLAGPLGLVLVIEAVFTAS